jgi:hypothetical protein
LRFGPREGIEPVCPFCSASLARPTMITVSTAERVTGGTCGTCGAVYLVDPTSKNVGEMMTQGLGIVAEKLSKNMADLIAGEDYEDAVLSYDWRMHRSPGISKGFMDRYGRLYIIKVKQRPS